MTVLQVAGVNLGFYPDQGDAGGRKSYLSDLDLALTEAFQRSSASTTQAPTINTVGSYAQTYTHEHFTGFQLMPQVEHIKRQHERSNRNRGHFVYDASVMPYQSWIGYTSANNTKALEIAQVMQKMLQLSRNHAGQFTIAEIRLRFGHEMNYYIRAGVYPPPTNAADPGADYTDAFKHVALACRALPTEYRERIKMFWCPNIASTSSGAVKEYQTYLPDLDYIDYVGIDYYCPSPGNLNTSDFVGKMKKVHDKWASPTRPFVLGETGLHFDHDQGGGIEAKLKWLDVITSPEARKALSNMTQLMWFNYEKDLDYRLLWVGPDETDHNTPFVNWLATKMHSSTKPNTNDVADSKAKLKRFFKTLVG